MRGSAHSFGSVPLWSAFQFALTSQALQATYEASACVRTRTTGYWIAFTALLAEEGHHLVCRVRTTAVAYRKAPPPAAKRRGRPKLYGDKVLLRTLFQTATFIAAPSPVSGETDVEILYFAIDLLWPPVGRLVRFVFVKHPSRGNIIFMTTDLLLSALDVIELYGLRFKIEVSFKQAVHNIGTYAYHFWMKDMARIKRRSGDQYLHRRPREYRDAVVRKMRAYHAHIELGVIAQGMMQYIAMLKTAEVWASFGSWLRTIRPDVPPSEQVVQTAMRNTFAEFLADNGEGDTLAKFIAERCTRPEQMPVNSASSG